MEKNQPRIAKLFKTALLGLATVVLATACNKTTEPPIRPDETAKYNISGQVLGNNLENSDLTALAGVTVSYKFGSVSDETTTDANGYFSFEGLVSAGRYDLTFSLGGYNTTYYSLEFPTLRGTIIDYQLKITMVKLPAGMTTVDPAAGGTVPVTGAVTAQLTVNPSTTVKDASGKDIAGEINITATPVNDIVTGQAESTTGLAVLQFLPEGYRFSPALNLAVQNPMTNHYFGNTFLQYYDAGTGMWNTMSQPVTFAIGAYNTTIDHFSIYKIGFSNGRSEVSSESRSIDVIDGVIDNTGKLEPVPVIFAKVQRLTGYVYTTPIADALQAAGITSDVDELTAEIQKVIKASNQGVDAVDQMTTVESEIPVNISVPANTKLTMTAQQVVTTVAYTFNIMSTSGSSYSVVVNTLVPANSVSVTTDFTPGDTHTVPGGDGTGGGGSN